jgi:alpha-glucuronidase
MKARLGIVFGLALTLIWLVAAAVPARAESGYDLWLRYQPVEDDYAAANPVTALVTGYRSPTLDAAAWELLRGLTGLLGEVPARSSAVTADGALVIGTPKSAPAIAALNLPLQALGDEGYLIRSAAMPAPRSGIGRRCPSMSRAASSTMPAPTPPSASTARWSTTSMPTPPS